MLYYVLQCVLAMRFERQLVRKISEYWTVKEAAEYLGLNPATIRILTNKGKLKHYRCKLSNYRLFLKEDLDDYLNLISRPIGCNIWKGN